MAVIDTFSKFGWAIPVRNKTWKEISQAFATIRKQVKQAPKFLQTDRGQEFYNSDFARLMKQLLHVQRRQDICGGNV